MESSPRKIVLFDSRQVKNAHSVHILPDYSHGSQSRCPNELALVLCCHGCRKINFHFTKYFSSVLEPENHKKKLSTFFGVVVPVTLSMFSVILFLRLGFVIGQVCI